MYSEGKTIFVSFYRLKIKEGKQKFCWKRNGFALIRFVAVTFAVVCGALCCCSERIEFGEFD